MAAGRQTNAALDERLDQLESRAASSWTAISFLKWFGGLGLSSFLVVAATAFVKAEAAGEEARAVKADMRVQFAKREEQYKQIHRDLLLLDRKIDERFAQVHAALRDLVEKDKR